MSSRRVMRRDSLAGARSRWRARRKILRVRRGNAQLAGGKPDPAELTGVNERGDLGCGRRSTRGDFFEQIKLLHTDSPGRHLAIPRGQQIARFIRSRLPGRLRASLALSCRQRFSGSWLRVALASYSRVKAMPRGVRAAAARRISDNLAAVFCSRISCQITRNCLYVTLAPTSNRCDRQDAPRHPGDPVPCPSKLLKGREGRPPTRPRAKAPLVALCDLIEQLGALLGRPFRSGAHDSPAHVDIGTDRVAQGPRVLLRPEPLNDRIQIAGLGLGHSSSL